MFVTDGATAHALVSAAHHTLRVCLVTPPLPFSGRVPMAPPVLEYLGALVKRTLPMSSLRLVDANETGFDPDTIEADIVGISAMTATVTWAYETADRLRERGVPVVLGGIHPTALPKEAKEHADAVVVGEAESVMAELLHDAAAGELRDFYFSERPELDDLPLPLTGALKGPYRFRAVFTARGCPYRCTFCSVHRFFGDTVRYRRIEDVVEEVRRGTGPVWFNGDDNIWGGDAERTISLFDALAAGRRRHWFGFGDLGSIQGRHGDRMLEAARRSGLLSVWAGWETSSASVLQDYHATGKQGADREEAVRRIQRAGIDVTLFMVLGSREDSIEDFDNALALADKLKVGVHPVLLTPLPGTDLYRDYEPYLIPGAGWDRYTGTHAVFEHPDPAMTAAVREECYHRTAEEAVSLSRTLRRMSAISMRGFPLAHAVAFGTSVPMRRALHKAYEEWREGRCA